MQNEHVLDTYDVRIDNLVIGKHDMALKRKKLYALKELQPPSNMRQSEDSLL